MQKSVTRALKVVVLASALIPFQFEFTAGSDGDWSIGLRPAHAESGSGRDGNDDNGRGRGRGRGGDDDRDDDDKDDNDDDDDDRNDNRDTTPNRDRQSNARLGAEFNITLQYTNDWQEWVKDGRYVLIDPKGRTVANRRASRDDVARMRSLVGQ